VIQVHFKRVIEMNRRDLTKRALALALTNLGLFLRPVLAQTAPPRDAAPTIAWPDATNTGAPAGAIVASHDGPLVIEKVGTVISGLDIRGPVYINAPNVTLQKCKVTAAHFVVIKITASGATVQDCTINGTGSGNDGSHGIQGTGTLLRNNISNVENGITVDGTSPTFIQDNYIHDLLASGSPHYDGIQIDGGISNVTIQHNTIINSYIQTSAVMIDNYYGAISNIKVDSNLLVGGGYTIYVDGHFNANPIVDVSITNNHLARGHWGITNFNKTTPLYKGNVNDGAALARTLAVVR
jgi:hypothetical protein